jgi:hypothetical protein
MGDQDLRSKARKAKAGGARESVAALAGARRHGTAREDVLAALAALGHEPARAVLGVAPAPAAELSKWFEPLAPFATREVTVIAGTAALASFLPLWDAVQGEDDRPRRALAAARAWADCPCKEHLDATAAAIVAANEARAKAFDAYRTRENELIRARTPRDERVAIVRAPRAASYVAGHAISVAELATWHPGSKTWAKVDEGDLHARVTSIVTGFVHGLGVNAGIAASEAIARVQTEVVAAVAPVLLALEAKPPRKRGR